VYVCINPYMYTWSVQEILDLKFPAQTDPAREVSIVVDLEGTFMRMREFFPL